MNVPTDEEFYDYIDNIIINESIIFPKKSESIYEIIKESQQDFRRIINILFIFILENKEISFERTLSLIKTIHKKIST